MRLNPSRMVPLFGNFAPGASLALDFVNGRYRVGAGRYAISDFSRLPGLTVSRASVGYDLAGTIQYASNIARVVPGFGLLVEEARTNLFLNSFAPATQTITLSATGNYTITVWGTGSVAVAAGTATITGAGSASDGSPRTINCTVTGTITVTVTGSPRIVQAEAGAFGTSPIPTLGASATRAADQIQISGQAAILQATAGAWIGRSITPGGSMNGVARVVGSDATNAGSPLYLGGGIGAGAPNLAGTYNGTVAHNRAITPTIGAPVTIAATFDATPSRRVTGQGLAPANSATAFLAGSPNIVRLGYDGTTNYLDSYLQTVLFYPRTFADAELQAATQ